MANEAFSQTIGIVILESLAIGDIIAIVVALIASIGGASWISSIINKSREDKITSANIEYKHAETEKIIQDIHANYRAQTQKWLTDLEEIQVKHHTKLSEKDEEIARITKEYLEAIKKLEYDEYYIGQKRRGYRQLMNKLDMAHWETDGQGKVIFANGKWLTLFGLKLEEAMGENWISALVPESRDSTLLEWQSRIVDHNDYEPLHFTIKNKITGEVLPLYAVYSTIYDINGNPLKFIGVTFIDHAKLDEMGKSVV